MQIKQISFDTLIIYFENKISKEVSINVKTAYNSILNQNIEGLIDIIPSYSSILINYDFFKYEFKTLKRILEEKIVLDKSNEIIDEVLNIDVYYGLEVGFDLEEISKKTKLSIDEIINLHSHKFYDVYAIGFLPGFAYLGEVDEKISIPRLETPRKIIPKGSVAIANTQTAIYPQNSPGGWNIIGKTLFKCFDKNLKSLSPFKVGQKIKFNPISKKEFLAQGGILWVYRF